MSHSVGKSYKPAPAKAAYQLTLEENAQTLARLRSSLASDAARGDPYEVSRIVSIDGVGKDGLFRVMRRHVSWHTDGTPRWAYTTPHELVIPPAWLDKSGKRIGAHFTELLKPGAVVFGHRVEGAGQIMTKSRDRSVKDSVTTYTYLSAVLPAADELEWFAAGILIETPLGAPPPASHVEEQRRKAVMLASAATAAGGASWETDDFVSADAATSLPAKKGKKSAAAAAGGGGGAAAPASVAPVSAPPPPKAEEEVPESWEDAL
jgi:hypothetical protein